MREPPGGFFAHASFVFYARVYVQNTDCEGIVYHAEHLRFAEQARTEMLRAMGLPLRTLAQAYGGFFVVGALQISYHKPLFLDDLIEVRLSLKKMGHSSLTLTHDFFRDGERVVDIEGRLVWINQDKKAAPMPPPVRSVFQSHFTPELPFEEKKA